MKRLKEGPGDGPGVPGAAAELDVDLPGGDFATHFTFAQALTESAAATPGCLLVVSLPSSDSNEYGG